MISTIRGKRKQRETLRAVFKSILKEVEKAETWSIDKENHVRELSTSEMIDLGLMDGYSHIEDTGNRTITIKYKTKRKKGDTK